MSKQQLDIVISCITPYWCSKCGGGFPDRIDYIYAWVELVHS